MKNKLFLLSLLFFVCILSISAISAAENTTNKDVISIDNNLETSIHDDVSTSKGNCELNLEQNNNGELKFADLNMTINGNSNSTIYLSNNYKYNDSDSDFKDGVYINRDLTIYGNGVTIDGDLVARIFKVADNVSVGFHNITFFHGKADDDMGGAIYHGNAYNCTFAHNVAGRYAGAIYQGNAYNCTFISDSADGAGAIYQGNAYNCNFTDNQAKDGGAILGGDAYNCTFSDNFASNAGGAIKNGNAYNCIFTSNHANDGGAMYEGSAYNCTFTGNNVGHDGGAMFEGSAYNCTFIENHADHSRGGALFMANAFNCTFRGNNAIDGQAMYQGTACLCNFNGDPNRAPKIIPAIISVLNYVSTYNSGEKLKFNVTADGKVYDGLRTTIKIKIKDELVQTAHGLTGEGWIVDLVPGEYNVVLSLTDYPDEEPSSATVIVSKGNATIDISLISNAKVGKEVTINYTTNSNGTVTIKVNGKKINGNKFTPTKEGIYNVTVEVAENYYYTAATKQVTFNVTKYVVKLSENKDLSPLYSAKATYKVLVTCDGQAAGAGETVTIKFNGKTYPVLTNSKGYAILNLKTKVKPKTYIITAEYHGVKVSNKVTVKNIIDAKDKKVKKSKKVNKVKVSLKKVNGKYLKGEVLKIKFNKKTYKVKTNKKGKATWKVKKSMLKNLKIGKKYKYKVTYGKDVATKKLMIKK